MRPTAISLHALIKFREIAQMTRKSKTAMTRASLRHTKTGIIRDAYDTKFVRNVCVAFCGYNGNVNINIILIMNNDKIYDAQSARFRLHM